MNSLLLIATNLHLCVRLLLLLFLLLPACHRTPAPPSPSAAASVRLIPHSPAAAVIIRDLGHADLCVARHAYDLVLPRSLPIIGSQEGFDYEALIAAQPTHIITQWGSRTLPSTLTTLAATNHWHLFDTTLLTLDDIRRDTRAIDALLCSAIGLPAPSQEAQQLLSDMDRAWSPRGAFTTGRVLLLASTAPPAAFGPGSCHQQILEAIGATPAITRGNAYIELSAESLLALAPDTIILISPRSGGAEPVTPETHSQRTRDAFAMISSLAIPAARQDRLALLDDPLSQLPSTSMIRLADDLAAVLSSFER